MIGTVAVDRLESLPIGWRQLKGRPDTASHEIGERIELEIRHCLEFIPFARFRLVAIECGLEIDGRRVQCDQLGWPWPRERHFFWRRIIGNVIEDEALSNRVCGR